MRLLTSVVLLVAGSAGCDARGPLLSVFAASSLADAFEELAQVFQASDPRIQVVVTTAGSQVLRVQIEHGADAQVFVSADDRHIEALRAAGRVQSSHRVAYTQLALIVPPDNPSRLRAFADLPQAARLVIANENVPVGRYTRQLLERAGFASAVLRRVASEEHNVRLVRAKVELGIADAAIVYEVDVSAAVRAIPIPSEYNVRVDYTMAILTPSTDPEVGAAWVRFVLSDAGRSILRRHRFGTDGHGS